jgi:hypothetical protein
LKKIECNYRSIDNDHEITFFNNMTSSKNDQKAKFDLLITQHEIKPDVSKKLWNVLSTCKIVLLCDDSQSMQAFIREGGVTTKTTRWQELKTLTATLIDFITATNSQGLDIHFLNRSPQFGVVDKTGLQAIFSINPVGMTPLIDTLGKVYDQYVERLNGQQLLIVVITDGEPTDGSSIDLYNKLVKITRGGNVHVSFAECTDDPKNMEYLDEWDGEIPNFDNTDDYREEKKRVKEIQGELFKFDYTDYVIKILLATFDRWYFNLDQKNVTKGCCAIS